MTTQIHSLIKASLFGLILLCAAGTARADNYSSGLTFGRPQIRGGVCVGAGVCVEGVTDIANSSDPEAIAVTFSLLPNDNTTLVMTFSMTDLQNNQPDQVALFTNSNGTYTFDQAYQLNSTGFQQLNLLPNAAILPTTPSAVVINGDIVTVYFKYYYTQN